MTDEYINGYRQGFTDGLDIKHNMKYQMFGMNLVKVLEVLSDYHKSQTSNIPIGFSFVWKDKEVIDKLFEDLYKQGFKVTK